MKKMHSWAILRGVGLAAALLFGGASQAAPFIYGNTSTLLNSVPQRLYKIDLATGAVVQTCQMSKGNGRGIVVIGGIAYYTTADSANVYKADISTCADKGVAFTVAGTSRLSSMAYDGTNFWIADYAGSNKVFNYSPTGTLLKTITLGNCDGNCDGIEFFDHKLIANRGDGGEIPQGNYDVYDTNGTLVQQHLIGPTDYGATGIAYDGTNFYVSDILRQKLYKYDGATGALISTIQITGMVSGGGNPYEIANWLEDLSFDYLDRSDTGGGGTPAGSANFQGLWWNPNESGWGINFAHQADILFATWFIYDAQGTPVWLIAELHKTGAGIYAGGVSTVSGPVFNSVPFGPAPVETVVGDMTANFADTKHGSIAYTVNGTSQTKAIVPQEFGPLPTCISGAQPDLSVATNYTDLWWTASESGWGINFTHQGDIIFATWFTYDAAGKPRWLIAELHKGAAGVYSGTVSTVKGGPFLGVAFDPRTVMETPVGSATVTFANGNSATFAYVVNGATATKAITRQVFQPPGTSCQ